MLHLKCSLSSDNLRHRISKRCRRASKVKQHSLLADNLSARRNVLNIQLKTAGYCTQIREANTTAIRETLLRVRTTRHRRRKTRKAFAEQANERIVILQRTERKQNKHSRGLRHILPRIKSLLLRTSPIS